MTDIEQRVASHYSRPGVEAAIVEALRGAGKDVDRLDPDDLAGSDEFHLGWRVATVELARDLGLQAGEHVLDVGSGLGGPARYFAKAHGCRVDGVDLSAEFVAAAGGLTRRCGLDDRVTFRQASALALPFADTAFDAATAIHVGMNVADKSRMFAEVRRVLKPRGRFGVYDVMRTGAGDLPYPMPWAETPETSFVETSAVYGRLLRAAGFAIEAEHDRRELTLRLAREMRERVAREGPPVLSLAAIAGPAIKERLANVMSAVEQGLIAPVAIIARAM